MSQTTSAATREIRPAITMQHRSREECQSYPMTRLWQAWADRFGYRHWVGERHYYNLPGGGVESFDSDDTRSAHYWELHIIVPDGAMVPSYQAAMTADSVDQMMERHEAAVAAEAAAQQRALDEIAANAAAILAAYRKAQIYPRRDDLYREQCLTQAIWEAVPGSLAARRYSGSYIRPAQVFQILGIGD